MAFGIAASIAAIAISGNARERQEEPAIHHGEFEPDNGGHDHCGPVDDD